MKKLLSALVPILFLSFGTNAQISGPSTICVGGTAVYNDSLPGGTWSIFPAVIATISSGGVVTPVTTGTATVSYTVGSTVNTYSITVAPLPGAITGPTTVCSGSTIALTDVSAGGVWSSSNITVATVSMAGVVTGIAPGTTTIYYTMPSGCSVSYTVTVTGGSTAYITGDSSVCAGGSVTFSASAGGGTWTSSSTAVATVSSTGVVTGIAAGAAVISYSVTSGCGTSVATYTIMITGGTAGSISGGATVAIGGTDPLYDFVTGGAWTTSDPSIATVSSTGVVTGVSAGVATISYVVTGCSGGPYVASYPVSVSVVNRVSGTVHLSGAAVDSSSTIKVWLITYNSSTLDLEAVDSVVMPASAAVYYEFTSAVADSYRVKAAYFPATFSSTGYVPTYHTSGLHWYLADVFYHTYGTADDGKDINMLSGTVTAGPGFIGGSVTSGADRGTTGTVPVAGMLVLLINPSSGTVMQQSITNASGTYSFSNLPVGSYEVYPEAINYATTPINPISLTTTSPVMTGASFIQHTISHTITPATLAVEHPTNNSSIAVYPNPTSGKLNVKWQASAAKNGQIVITNVTGIEVYRTNLDLSKGNGVQTIDLSNMPSGTYIVNVKADGVNTVNKVQVSH